MCRYIKIAVFIVSVLSVLLSGCAVYAPTPYGYAVAPVVPVPGWALAAGAVVDFVDSLLS